MTYNNLFKCYAIRNELIFMYLNSQVSVIYEVSDIMRYPDASTMWIEELCENRLVQKGSFHAD